MAYTKFLQPLPADRRLARSVLLMVGLTLYGLSDAMLVVAGLGLDPWDVLHQGLSRAVGGQVGTWTDIVGVVVLLAWIPLRQKPGVGTVTNVVVIGIVVNICLALLPSPHGWQLQSLVMVSAVVLNALATGLYIGAGLGPGPRDGLMTGFAARGHSVRMVRTAIELTVLAVGWLLGGTVGAGTVLYALAIGPLVHVTLPLLSFTSRPSATGPRARSGRTGWGGSSRLLRRPT
ncbi:MAG: hypothetical protein QOJ11_1313 [Frankiales bacterium]|jgi:uncharacterized membrane protein YczE|nr:hypothetical protein [Frankiales bacterium]